jgi:phosphate:Na+ symporter
VFGFGLVFYSLKVVLDAAGPLAEVRQVTEFVTAIARMPWLALVAAVVFTALLRSSAATIGIVVGLSFAGLVRLEAAIPFVLGANIGTTFNAVMASWRGPVEARRVAVGHVLFKVIIVALALPFLPLLSRLFAATAADVPRQIANAHTLINVMAALLFLPLLRPLERLLAVLVPDRAGARSGPRYLDPGALEAPELAVAQVTREVLRMGDKVLRMYRAAMPTFVAGDKQGRRRIVAEDDEVDRLEEGITAYLARVPQDGASREVSRRVMALFYITDELEHIADVVSKGLMSYTRKKVNENLAFSEQGLAEMGTFHAEVARRIEAALAAVATWDKGLAAGLVSDRQWGVDRKRELHDRHLDRLNKGLKETRDTSTIHLDLIADLERVNFHCSQIGEAVVRSQGTAAASPGTTP